MGKILAILMGKITNPAVLQKWSEHFVQTIQGIHLAKKMNIPNEAELRKVFLPQNEYYRSI